MIRGIVAPKPYASLIEFESLLGDKTVALRVLAIALFLYGLYHIPWVASTLMAHLIFNHIITVITAVMYGGLWLFKLILNLPHLIPSPFVSHDRYDRQPANDYHQPVSDDTIIGQNESLETTRCKGYADKWIVGEC